MVYSLGHTKIVWWAKFGDDAAQNLLIVSSASGHDQTPRHLLNTRGSIHHLDCFPLLV